MQYFGFFTLLWMMFVSFMCYSSQITYKRTKITSLKKYGRLVFTALLPGILAAVPFTTGAYGPDGIICWVQLDIATHTYKGIDSSSFWKLLLYMPRVLITFVNICLIFSHLTKRKELQYERQFSEYWILLAGVTMHTVLNGPMIGYRAV